MMKFGYNSKYRGVYEILCVSLSVKQNRLIADRIHFMQAYNARGPSNILQKEAPQLPVSIKMEPKDF